MPFRKRNRTAFLNYLRAKYEMYTREVNVRSYPYFMGIDPSDICQLRCTTCPTGIDNARKKDGRADAPPFRAKRAILAPELFDALLDEMGEYLFWINFYNYGEPLLNKHLPAFIRKARERDICAEVHTNLSLPLPDDRIDAILDSGLDHLSASIDGFTQESYERHRVGGNLALVKKNLERLVEARARKGVTMEITYAMLVFSFNEHEKPAAEAYCRALGIHYNPRDAFIDDPTWLPSYRVNEQPVQLKPEARIREDVSQSYWPLPRVEARAHTSCAWHYGYSVLTAGGPVAPCCPIADERYDVGTVVPGQVRFLDVWNGKLMRKSRADFAGRSIPELEGIETLCTRCPYDKAIQHLYSVFDIQVMTQFRRALASAEPGMDRAFDLLSRIRYGASLDSLCRDGDTSRGKCLFVGTESGNEPAEFVEFFRTYLLPTADVSPRGAPVAL